MAKKYRRTQTIHITPESIYLRRIRLKAGLSIRKVAKILSCSEALIRHIEKGRLDIPKGDFFARLLSVYGIPSEKSFYDRLSRMKIEITPREELENIVRSIDDEKIKILLSVAKGLAN
ncbi:MAG: helix-turn-helix domain-containing protein [Oligoflexia bacterium]|nr:helix-turn-helix domain-containing protein [Oligoflexia bacterium]